MAVVCNKQDERFFHDHRRTSDSRCSTCWGKLSFPYAYWTLPVQDLNGDRVSMFFCNECYGDGVMRDLAELTRRKRIGRGRRDLHAMPIDGMTVQ
jgi:hypothetical protein